MRARLDPENNNYQTVLIIHARQALILFGLSAIVTIGALGFTVFALLNPDLFRWEEIGLAILLGMPWAWLTIRRYKLVSGLRHDLRTGSVSSVEGFAQRVKNRGFGLFAPTHEMVQIADVILYPTSKSSSVIGPYMSAQYATKSGILLSAKAMNPPRIMETVALTAKLAALLDLITQGLSDKLIARELGLSPSTVRTYNSKLFRKLGVTNRSDAIAVAPDYGLPHVDRHQSTP